MSCFKVFIGSGIFGHLGEYFYLQNQVYGKHILQENVKFWGSCMLAIIYNLTFNNGFMMSAMKSTSMAEPTLIVPSLYVPYLNPITLGSDSSIPGPIVNSHLFL